MYMCMHKRNKAVVSWSVAVEIFGCGVVDVHMCTLQEYNQMCCFVRVHMLLFGSFVVWSMQSAFVALLWSYVYV